MCLKAPGSLGDRGGRYRHQSTAYLQHGGGKTERVDATKNNCGRGRDCFHAAHGEAGWAWAGRLDAGGMGRLCNDGTD